MDSSKDGWNIWRIGCGGKEIIIGNFNKSAPGKTNLRFNFVLSYEAYGDFDKIRRHKYGIYSLEWKKEQYEYAKKQKENERSVQSRVSKSMKQIDKPRVDISTGSIKHAKCGSSKSNTCKLIHDSNSNVSNIIHNDNRQQQSFSISGNTQGDKLNYIKMNNRAAQMRKNTFASNLNITFPRRKH